MRISDYPTGYIAALVRTDAKCWNTHKKHANSFMDLSSYSENGFKSIGYDNQGMNAAMDGLVALSRTFEKG